ncbi:MAG TPA: hypothetical protein V6D19_12195 [Stenomitos sp.]
MSSRRLILTSASLAAVAAFSAISLISSNGADAQKVQRSPRSADGHVHGQGSSFADPLLTGVADCPAPYTAKNVFLNVFGNELTGCSEAPNINTPLPASNLGPVNGAATISYGSVGSGGGRTAFCTHTPNITNPNEAVPSIEFAVTDTPASKVTLGTCDPVQVPLTIGSVALVTNKGIPALTPGLTTAQFCSLFNGNPVTVGTATISKLVYRNGNSGTNAILISRLNDVCGANPKWPVNGQAFVFPSNSFYVPDVPTGTSSTSSTELDKIKATAGSAGYVDGAIAALEGTKIKVAKLQNKAGSFISGTSVSGISGAVKSSAITDIDPNPKRIELNVPTDPAGTGSYPIIGATYLWLYSEQNNGAINPFYTNADVNTLLDFVGWYTFDHTTTACTTSNTDAECILTKQLPGYAALKGTPTGKANKGTAYVGGSFTTADRKACPANNATSTNINDLVRKVVLGCV